MRGRIRFFGLVVAVALVLTACDWSMFGYGPDHLRSSPETSLSSSNVGALTTKWTLTTNGSVHSSPAVVNGVVYVGSFDFKVYAVNATSGRLLWTATTGGGVFSSPAVVQGVVYVGSEDNKVYAFKTP